MTFTRHSLLRLLGMALLAAQAHAQVVAPTPPIDPQQRLTWRIQAVAHELGEGTTRDMDVALRLYCRAALAGDVVSAASLGAIHAEGRGVPRNDALAAHWFARAALLGDAQAEAAWRQLAVAPQTPDCVREQEARDARAAAEQSQRASQARQAEAQRQAQARRTLADAYRAHVDTPAQQRIMKIVDRLAPRFGLEPGLVYAVIRAESNFNPNAVSDKQAQGLMQLIPETARRFSVRNALDPEQNIRGGMAYLRWLLAYFQGQVPLAVAAYNAGEGAVEKYGGIPPYAETRDYVQRIQRFYALPDHPFDGAITAPSPLLAQAESARR